MLDHFHQTHDRQRLQRKTAVDSRRDHARPTDTTKFYLRITRLERLHQAGTQQITGHLSGHNIDACNLAHGKLALADNSARRYFDRGRKGLGIGERKTAADLFQCLSNGQLLTIDQAVTLIKRLDGLGRETTPLETDRVEAMYPGRIAV